MRPGTTSDELKAGSEAFGTNSPAPARPESLGDVKLTPLFDQEVGDFVQSGLARGRRGQAGKSKFF